MSEDDERQGVKWWTPILIVVVTYLVPYQFSEAFGGGIQMISPSWMFTVFFNPYRIVIEVLFFRPEVFLINLGFHLFALQWYRLYDGKASVRTTLFLGVLSVTFYWIAYVMTLLPSLWDSQWPYRTVTSLIIPFHAVIAWLFIRACPPPQREEDTRPEWLEGQGPTSKVEGLGPGSKS